MLSLQPNKEAVEIHNGSRVPGQLPVHTGSLQLAHCQEWERCQWGSPRGRWAARVMCRCRRRRFCRPHRIYTCLWDGGGNNGNNHINNDDDSNGDLDDIDNDDDDGGDDDDKCYEDS